MLPRDLSRLVANEQTMVQNGIHSRRRAMYEIGVRNPELEFENWLEERAAILRMNKELNSKPSRGGMRERAAQPQAEGDKDLI